MNDSIKTGKNAPLAVDLQRRVMRTVRIIGPGTNKCCNARIQEKVLTTVFGTFYLDTKKWIVDDSFSFQYEDN